MRLAVGALKQALPICLMIHGIEDSFERLADRSDGHVQVVNMRHKTAGAPDCSLLFAMNGARTFTSTTKPHPVRVDTLTSAAVDSNLALAAHLEHTSHSFPVDATRP